MSAQRGEMEFAALVGWDWADEQHEVRLQATGSDKVERFTIAQQPESLCEWVQNMRERFGGGKVAVGIEQARGPVIYALMAYDFIVIFPINPKSLARFREAFRPSKAKDDPVDADLLLEMLSKHRTRLRAWRPEEEKTRTLRMLAEYRRTTVERRGQCIEQLKSILKCYFPQALQWAGDLKKELAWDFLATWPTLEAVKQAGEAALRQLYSKHHCRRTTIQQRVGQITQAMPLTTDQAVVRASALMVQGIISQLRCLSEVICKFDQEIAEMFADYPERDLFDSFPGAGAALTPRLAVAFGTDRSRYESAEELLRFSGVAPVMERSGKSSWVHRRYARPVFLHQTFVEYAKQSIIKSPWAKAYYQERKRLGQKRYHILRSLAYKWIRIMYRCWVDRTPYDETLYQSSLARRGSRVAALLASAPGANSAAAA